MEYKKVDLEVIDRLWSELQKLQPFTKENQERLQKKVRLEFNYNSNHLEGNTLTYGQTQLLLFFDKSSGDVPVSDIEEMKAHDVALSQIIEMAKNHERPLTELFIKELNKTILVKPFWKDAITSDGNPTRKKIEIGKYKSTPNSVHLRNGRIHEYASPQETPALVSDLLIWYKKNSSLMHPVHLAIQFHYKFVSIHPFDDGNGRVARLLMNYILMKHDYPIVIIKSQDKENYLTALQKADLGDISTLLQYGENLAAESLNLSLKAGRGEDIDELGDIEKQIEILKREKLSRTKIYKSPKVCFDLIEHVKNDLWYPLHNALNRFTDFFGETDLEVYLDGEKYRETKVVSNPKLGIYNMYADKEVNVKKYPVYGRDLADEDDALNTVVWVKKMLSLKSASKKMDYNISCTLTLNEASYGLKILEYNSNGSGGIKERIVLFEIENEYKSYFMNDIVERILKIASKHFIEIIQSNK